MTDDCPVMVITGTSRGIGRGMAEHFAGGGYRVIGCSRGVATLQAEAYEHKQVDVSSEEQVRKWTRWISRTYQRVDVLVCNAGITPSSSPLALTSGDTWESLLRSNVMGTYYVCREIAKIMTLRRSGRIITVSSMAVGLHQEGTSAYSASKSAVVEMTKILAKELAPAGITCNVLAPSMIMTDSVEALGDAVAARVLEDLTIKRELTMEEICNVVSFFAAPESRSITGQVVYMGLVC